MTAIGTVVGGIGTAGAFGVAAGAFLIKARNDRSAQARLIHAHMPRPPSAFDFQDRGPGHISTGNYADTDLHNELVSYAGEEFDFYIEDDATLIWPTLPNLSQEFIFDIELSVFGDGTKWAQFKAATAPPGSDLEFLAVLTPDHRRDADFTFQVRFTDAVGRRWESRSGRQTRLKGRAARSRQHVR